MKYYCIVFRPWACQGWQTLHNKTAKQVKRWIKQEATGEFSADYFVLPELP